MEIRRVRIFLNIFTSCLHRHLSTATVIRGEISLNLRKSQFLKNTNIVIFKKDAFSKMEMGVLELLASDRRFILLVLHFCALLRSGIKAINLSTLAVFQS